MAHGFTQGSVSTKYGMYQFCVPGTIAAGTNVAGSFFPANDIVITAIHLFCDTAGATGTTVVDVNADGTSLFPSGTKPTLTNTGVSNTDVVPDTTAVDAGAKITIDVDSITTTAPTTLYLVIEYI